MARFGIAGLALLVSMLSVGCGGADSAADDVADLDAEVAQELRNGAPRYDLRTAAILGEYSSDDGCPGGFSTCDRVVVEKEGDRVLVRLGYDELEARAWASRGVILFSIDGLDGDCDDPGCGNMVRVSGVIYPVKKGNKYVPQVKATYVTDFPYPEDEDSPSGEVKTVIRMKKR